MSLTVQLSRVVSCPRCNTFKMGTVYLRNNKSYLWHEGMFVRTGIRICPLCGEAFHFHGEEEDKRRGAIEKEAA